MAARHRLRCVKCRWEDRHTMRTRSLIGSSVFLWARPLPVLLRSLGGLCYSWPGWWHARLACSHGPRPSAAPVGCSAALAPFVTRRECTSCSSSNIPTVCRALKRNDVKAWECTLSLCKLCRQQHSATPSAITVRPFLPKDASSLHLKAGPVVQ
jgi:hypothetical protein